MKRQTYDCDVTIARLIPPGETVHVFTIEAYSLQQCIIKAAGWMRPHMKEDDNIVIIAGLSTNKP